MKTKYTTFEINGAKAVIYPVENIETVFVDIKIKGGVWYENEKKLGISHLLEHMLFKTGTKKFKTEEEIENYKENYGISGNASTGGDNISIWFKFPGRYVRQAMVLIEEILFYPIFPEERLNREKQVVVQEYKGYWDSPFSRFSEMLDDRLFGQGHIYCRRALGEPDKFNRVTRDDLVNLHRQYFQPKNMTFSVAGGIETDKVRKVIEKIIKGKENGISGKLRIGPTKFEAGKLLYRDKVEQSRISVCWQMEPVKKMAVIDRFSLSMANFIIGRGRKSFLWKNLRRQEGLAYSFGSTRSDYPTLGIFEIYADTEEVNTRHVIEAIKTTVDEYLEFKVTEDEFKKIKRYMDLQTMMGDEELGEFTSGIVCDLFYYDKIFMTKDTLKIAKEIGLNRVKNILRKTLDWDKAVVAVMKSEKIN